jgi:hypothetical protein
MAVPFSVRDGRPDPGTPVPLFKTGVTPTFNLDHFVVGPGGRSFLIRLPSRTFEPVYARLLINWFPD